MKSVKQHLYERFVDYIDKKGEKKRRYFYPKKKKWKYKEPYKGFNKNKNPFYDMGNNGLHGIKPIEGGGMLNYSGHIRSNVPMKAIKRKDFDAKKYKNLNK